MRVAASVKLLRGNRRAAVYDIERGLCWPATDEQAAALSTLADGHYPATSTAVLSSMRLEGWLLPGAPRKHDLSIERLDRTKPAAFEHIWLEVTNSCNLKCNHCYASSGPDADRSSELPTSDWITIIDDAISYGVKKITFIGGEPTIRLELVDELSRHIRSKTADIQLRMFSNLSIKRVRAQTIDVVATHGIEFGTALYGMDSASHDRMTQREGSWAATMDAVHECLARDVDVFVGMYLSLAGENDVQQHEDWLRSLGVKKFQVLAPSKVGRGAVVNWKKTPRLNRLPGTLLFSEHQWQSGRKGHNCFYDHIAVMPDGSVSPCIMTRGVTYGNALELGLNGILRSSQYNEMATLSKDNIPGCRECEFRYACFDCRPDAMEGSGDFLRKPRCGYDPRLGIGEIIDDHT